MTEERIVDLAGLRALLGRLTNYERMPDFHAGRVRVDLERMRELVRRLGHPERAAPVLHVTGTKGKGSTATLAARLLTAHGLVTGLHTSPHLERMEERVRVDLEPIDGPAMIEATNRILDAVPSATPAEFPTFFEWVTLVAFLHFRERRVDVAVHEVGLGGRLDATNVVLPTATVVTQVDLEHTRVLGGTIEAIAAEKAGIVKPGAPLFTAVPIGHPAEPVLIHAAAEAGVETIRLGRELDARVVEVTGDGMTVEVRLGERSFGPLRTSLLGAHQAENLALALAASETLLEKLGRALDPDTVARALEGFVLPGRLELLARSPTVLVDGAHTAASLRGALEAARSTHAPARVVLVLAMAGDKDLDAAAEAAAAADRVVVTRYDHPRAAPPDELAARVEAAGGTVETVPDLQKACSRALDLAEREGLVLVAGSLYLIGPARRAIAGPLGDRPWSTSRTSS